MPLVEAIYTAADKNGIREAERRTVQVRLDGRLMTLETILGTIQHHAEQEYPFLLRSNGQYNIAAIHATNMNNRYWLVRLREESSLQIPEIQAALTRLSAHLEAIPSEPD